jgi:hypothetical protein
MSEQRNKQIINETIPLDDNQKDIEAAVAACVQEQRITKVVQRRERETQRGIIAELYMLMDDIASKGIAMGTPLFKKVLGKCIAARIWRRRDLREKLAMGQSYITEGWDDEMQGELGDLPGDDTFEQLALEQNPSLRQYKR